MANTARLFLDTSPRWLSLTLVFSASALAASGIGFLFLPLAQFSITPFTLFLHLIWAISISSSILNLRIKISPEKKPLLAIGTVVALGSAWSSLQQWISYQQNGMVNDLILVIGTMLMDVVGGAVTYILYHFNALRNRPILVSSN